MTKKMRIGIVLTAIWIVFFGIAVVTSNPWDRGFNLFFMSVPPMIGWGIWWIRKA